MADSGKFDAIIVGSGMAGSLAAARLTAKGKRVLILEAGPQRQLTDLISSQIWARKLKWGGAPVIETGEQKIGHGFNNGWGTGGAAMHHFAVWPRLHENDFNMQSQYQRGLDWPIDYETLMPWYDQVQDEVGIAGDHEQEIWRPQGAPYNQAPVPVFAQGRILAKGFEALGKRTAPLPLAILTADKGERKACIWDGWCDAGCPIGSLANPLVTYLPRALNAGAEILHRAYVTHIQTDPSGTRAQGVHWLDEQGGSNGAQADVIVVAASTVQNSRLLLVSANHGFSNRHQQIGKYLSSHLNCSIFGLFAEETQCHLGATGGQLLNQDEYIKERKDGPFGSFQWMIANAFKPNDLLGMAVGNAKVYGASLDAFMKKAAKHFGTMSAVVEDLPLEANQVSLSDQQDSHGIPLAIAHHNSSEDTTSLWEYARQQGMEVFSQAGATEIWSGAMAGMHILGGTIMGNDRTSSVTNSYGQCHEVNNVFVAGASLFPSNGGVNPTFTINALTSRSMDHLINNWSDIK